MSYCLLQDPAVSFACRQAIEYTLKPKKKRRRVVVAAPVAPAPSQTVTKSDKQPESLPPESVAEEDEEERQQERRPHDREAAAAFRRMVASHVSASGRPRMVRQDTACSSLARVEAKRQYDYLLL